MNTKLLMTASAFLIGILGIICSLFPEEILVVFQQAPNFILILLIQILGALYFGFGIMNWMAKTLLIGGIYSKPISIGNFCHFAIAGIALIKVTFSSQNTSKYILILAVVYFVFAFFFGIIFFTNPQKKS